MSLTILVWPITVEIQLSICVLDSDKDDDTVLINLLFSQAQPVIFVKFSFKGIQVLAIHSKEIKLE